ncbi:MAG: PadR family transcriptional regulator [Nanoarchaeota archaeon]
MKTGPLKLEFKGFLSFLILHEISLKGLSGEDLAKKIGSRRGSQLTPGTIYPTLKKLRKLRLVQNKRFGRRKVYSLTEEGRKELKMTYSHIGTYMHGLQPYLKAPKKTVKK